MKLNPSNTSIPKLPDSYVIQSPVELAQTDVFAPRFGLNKVRPLGDLRGAKDEAYLVHVANVLKQSASADGDVITWAWYNSLLANDVSVIEAHCELERSQTSCSTSVLPLAV